MQPPRRMLHLALGKVSAISEAVEIGNLRRSEEMAPVDSDTEVASRIFPQYDVNRQSASTQSSVDESSQGTEEGASQGEREIPGSSFRPTAKLQQRVMYHRRLVKAIEEFLCVPFYSTCELRGWITNPTLSFFDKADPDYKRAVSTVSRKIQFLSCKEIFGLIQHAKDPVWYARSEAHYLSEVPSIQAVQMLLLHQYEQPEEVRKFLQRVYNVCERREPKRNSMFVCGPPNCGKTWFFDMVCAYYLNVGHVANFVRGEHFPLNDCVGRRILMWNEPNLMLSAYDTVKMLAGGDPCPANVKYQGHSVISRTPLILTGNRRIFQKDEIRTSRMYFEQWIQCAPLKLIKQYPLPTALYKLFVYYQIDME